VGEARSGFFGTGISGAAFALILAACTLLFLFAGGALWKADPSESHVLRIVISYLIAVPLCAAALAVSRAFTWTRLLSSSGLIWGAKLVTTSTLFLWLTPGSASSYEPTRKWDDSGSVASAKHDKRALYRAASGEFASSKVEGSVRVDGAPLAGGLVLIDDPGPGLPLDSSLGPIDVSIGALGYVQPMQAATTGQSLVAHNTDTVLHTLELVLDGRTVANVPLPPRGPEHTVPLPPPGRYVLACASHQSEHAALIVLDHPYFASTGPDGRFEIQRIPRGSVSIAVVRGAELLDRRSIELSQETVTVDFSIEGKKREVN
jgi:hypothetical protein